jgi:hypothetical protein
VSRIRRWAAALVMSAAATATLAPLGAAAASATMSSAAARVPCADAAADGDVTVAFVIDFSGAAGAPGDGIVKACVAVASDDNDSEALAAVAAEEGFAVPRYNDRGLLCAIGGVPASGCGNPLNGGKLYDYWSYWQGSPSGWTYANTGPAENQVDSSVVQGWRWEDPGAANPSDPKPRGPSTPGSICDTGPPPTTTTTTITTAPPSTGVSTVPTTTGGSRAGSGPTTTEAGGDHGATRPAPAVPTTTTTGKHAAATSPASAAGSESEPGSATADPARGREASSDVGASSRGSGGTPWLVILLVVLLVGALGAGATYRWRQAPPS